MAAYKLDHVDFAEAQAVALDETAGDVGEIAPFDRDRTQSQP